jgi:hypothetical protein
MRGRVAARQHASRGGCRRRRCSAYVPKAKCWGQDRIDLLDHASSSGRPPFSRGEQAPGRLDKLRATKNNDEFFNSMKKG